MARVTATIVGKVKRSPVKAGSKPRPHGLYPTQAVITLTAKIKEKRNV